MRSTPLILAIVAVAAPASSQTMLDKLIQRIGKPKGAAASPSQPSGGQFSSTIAPAQSATIDRLLAQPLQDSRIAADRTEAAPLIRSLLTTAGCAKVDAAWNSLNRLHMTPWSGSVYSHDRAPMGGMSYHDKGACVDVSRMTEWSKPANNALGFKVYYVAGDSGEASSQGYQLQKSADGQWLIRDIGLAFK